MFPLKKTNISISLSENDFLNNYDNDTEIPLLPHPGAFSKKRKFHQHEGIDLYCNDKDEVVSIEDGVVINIKEFTGEIAGSDWWNNTWCILIEGLSGVYNYGEVIPNEKLKIGASIKEGDLIGNVTTVLKKDKGRPMNMLHLELYDKGTKEPLLGWNNDDVKPIHLLDPTSNLLKMIPTISKKSKI
jgi:hypothetical protein